MGPAHQRNRADAQDQRRRGPAAGRAQHSARAHLHAGGSRERGRVRRLAAGQLHERGDHHARRRPAEGTARLTSVIVDVHVHYVSPGAFDAARRQPDTYGVRLLPGDGVRLQIGDEPPTRPLLPALYTLDLHTKFLAEQGIDTAVFGPLMDVAAYSLPMAQGAAWSRLQNEALAGALREAPGAHRGLATVPLQEPAAAAAELRFAVRELGLRGAMVDPNALGRPLGDGAFDPFWKAAADLAAPIVLHPFLLEAVERFGRHYLHNLVGYPFETTLAAASLILGGTLDRFPGLSVVLVHGGGFLPYHIGRFDRAHETRPEARVDDAGLPSRYLRRFFYDTLVQRPEALRYLVQLVGHDRVMLGSDHPFWMGDPDPLRVVREAGLDPATEAAIFGENAAQIFHLRP
ncbi:MAG: amidohydrolase [Candidatus Rokuibacteriota bacterium]|nr:MAG: amidohydrolase [Candidatus Rokubacteria bacterium]